METANETLEEVKPQTLTEEQKEAKAITDQYAQLCMKRGDLLTKQDALDEELDKIRLEIYNLNQKYKKLAEKQQKEAQNGSN